MNQVLSRFDFVQLAAAARRATDVLEQLKESKENLDLSPVVECGQMIRPLLANDGAPFNALHSSAIQILSSAAQRVDSRLKSKDRVRCFLSEVVGTTRNIAKVNDDRMIVRTQTFLASIAA